MNSRFAFAALALGLGMAAFASTSAADLPEIPFEFYTLDNGLEVILHEDHSTPIVGVNIWYHVGSKNERYGRSGFAHLFEHMMFQGSEHHDDEYFEPIQRIGGTLNGSTSEDRTNYWEIVPANHLRRALIMEADRMGWLLPAMTQEKFENQQDVVRNERREWQGSPYMVFWLTFNEHFYPKGHPYDHSVIGIHEDLANATLEDVKDFFRTYYTPNNATLSIAGDFDPGQTKEWIEELFGPIPPGPPVSEVATWVPELEREKRVHLQDRVQLTRLHYAWHTPPYFHEGDADVNLGAQILGQGRTSRLYRRLVHEEKLAQDVFASQNSQQLSSFLLVQITLAPGAEKARVERILDEELAKFVKGGPTREELERAKNGFEASFIRGIQRIGSWGGRNDRLNRYNHYVGTPDYFRQDYDRFLSRTQDTVRETFEQWIGPGRMVVEVAPFEEHRAVEVAADLDRSVLPEGEEERPFTVPPIRRDQLDNGLGILVMEHSELPLIQLDLVFRSGTANDPDDRGGLCDFAVSMLEEGTKKHDKFEFEEELDFLGTNLYTWTDLDRTVITMSCLGKHLDRSLELLAEMLLEPAFPEKEFEDEKERRLVDIRQEIDDPNVVAAKVTRRIMYGDGHPYSRLGTGTEETMAAITLDDVRGFVRTHITPGNATLVAVGDTDVADLKARVGRYLGDWRGQAPPSLVVPKPEKRGQRTVFLVDKPGDTQSTIRIAHFGLPRDHEDWEAVFVANRVLGGFFSSRLNLNLREDKGYTYGVRSMTPERRGTSTFVMSGRVQTEVTAPALVEFMNELDGVAGKRPITADELEFAKNSILLGYPREFETISQLAGAVNDQVTYGLPNDNLSRYVQKIGEADLDVVRGVADSYFRPENVAVIVVGDVGKIESSVKELGLGPIRYVDREGNFLDVHTDLSSR
jgi:zinc protease